MCFWRAAPFFYELGSHVLMVESIQWMLFFPLNQNTLELQGCYGELLISENMWCSESRSAALLPVALTSYHSLGLQNKGFFILFQWEYCSQCCNLFWLSVFCPSCLFLSLGQRSCMLTLQTGDGFVVSSSQDRRLDINITDGVTPHHWKNNGLEPKHDSVGQLLAGKGR